MSLGAYKSINIIGTIDFIKNLTLKAALNF